MELQITLQDVGVNLGYTIDSVWPNDGKVSHINTLSHVFFNQWHTTEAVIISGIQTSHILKMLQSD